MTKTFSRVALIAASAFVAACGSDGSTSPASSTPIETRLSATATAPTAAIADPMVSMKVTVTSSLPETVSGGVCAETVEARQTNGTTWTNVTSTSFACSAMAIVLAPGSSIDLTAVADQAKIRAVAGTASSVVLRARSSLAGASTNYTLQSTEVTWQLP
ncbi:MAG: hypothetical protein U5K74_07960 [Gemmatimonadaceae bacterium]|nr:hypothetical protein [Gemmatimonadaceae bacterium]